MKAVIFDCFGVLYLSHERALYERHASGVEALLPQLDDISAQCDYGFIDKPTANRQVAALLGISVAQVEACAAEGHVRNQTLIDYTQTLRGRYKVGLLSNISRGGIDAYLPPAERDALFDAVVLSGDIGLTKPHPHVFTAAAAALGVAAGDCVMIDDLATNCAGADAAGMRSIHYTSNQQAIRQLEVLLRTDV